MKRMIVFLLLFIVACSILYFKEQTKIDDFDFYKVTFVSKDYKEEFKNYISKNGNQYYYTFDNLQSKNFNINSLKLDGVVYYLDDNIDVNKLLSKLDFFYQGKNVEDYQIYYGYDVDIKDFVYVGGKKINIQIVKRSNDIVLGSPLILTGY